MFTKLKVAIIVLVLFGILGIVLFKLQKKIPPPPIVETPITIHKVIGTSVEARTIDSYTYGKGSEHIVFVGGMHGGYEWNSILLAKKFKAYFDQNINSIPENIKITVIPNLNPDGLYKVTNKEGDFTKESVSTSTTILASGRFNANGVDLNRNFDCKWKPESTWQNKKVSAGTSPFSEPEALALKNFVETNKDIKNVIFWHSKSNAVYASECSEGILPETLDIMNLYSQASGYRPIKKFDAYEITGDAEGWLASIRIPAITIELKTHTDIEWEKNLAGIKAIIYYYSQKKISI